MVSNYETVFRYFVGGYMVKIIVATNGAFKMAVYLLLINYTKKKTASFLTPLLENDEQRMCIRCAFLCI